MTGLLELRYQNAEQMAKEIVHRNWWVFQGPQELEILSLSHI